MSRKLRRRDFLKAGAAALGGTALAACTRSWELPADGGSSGQAGGTKAEADEGTGKTLVQLSGPGMAKDFGGALERLLSPLGGMAAFVKKGQTVLLKPNMSFAQPAAYRATTSSGLIAAVARAVLGAGAARVIVADYPVSDAAEVIAAMGLRDALGGLEVALPLISDDSPFVSRKLPAGRELSEVDLLAVAAETDVHIALPIAKSHNSAGFTGALKGAMGLIRSRKAFHWRHDLHQAVVDINTLIRPDLIIMDGLEVMSTDGPRGPGKLIPCHSLIAGTDPVAVDAAGVRLAPLYGKKIAPRQIRHLALAEAAGLGRLTPPADQMQHIAWPAAG